MEKNNSTDCPICVTNGYSKIQIEWLNSIMLRENINILHAENNGEYYITGIGHIDGYCRENNIVYEFHGDFFHGNPIKYEPNAVNPVSHKTYGELYMKTLERDKLIKLLGYNLITIWEYEYLVMRKPLNNNNLQLSY